LAKKDEEPNEGEKEKEGEPESGEEAPMFPETALRGIRLMFMALEFLIEILKLDISRSSFGAPIFPLILPILPALIPLPPLIIPLPNLLNSVTDPLTLLKNPPILAVVEVFLLPPSLFNPVLLALFTGTPNTPIPKYSICPIGPLTWIVSPILIASNALEALPYGAS
jgi:hypothetical protein